MSAIKRLGLLWVLSIGVGVVLSEQRPAGQDDVRPTTVARRDVGPSPAFVGFQTPPPPRGRAGRGFDGQTAIVPGTRQVATHARVTRSPSNDDCADAITFDLFPGQPVTFCDDNTGATEDCPALSGGAYRETWYKFTTYGTNPLTIRYCGTTPAFYNAYIVMDTTCPCSGAWVFASSWENSSCGDGNWTLNWNSLPAGTYYWPLLTDSADGYCEGPYCVTLDLCCPPPPPHCPANTLYGQPPYTGGDPWGAYTSAVTSSFSYTCFENYSVSAKIGDLHWWGLNLFFDPYYGWTLCDPTGVPFNVGFYTDNAGLPGTQTAAYNGVLPVVTDIGPYAWAEGYYFSLAALQPCSAQFTGWVSIQSQLNGADCAFLWLNGPTGDFNSLQQSGSTYTQLGTNLAFCLTGGDCPLIYGACCDDYTGVCNDGVEWGDCAGLRFTPDTLCADISPPCGILGACCDTGLNCIGTMFESECDAVGGRFFPGQTCPEFTCPADCEHRIDLYDCYGDGWNGNTLDVLVDGVTVLSQITLPSGLGPLSFTFMAATGDTIQTIYYPIGGWPYEPYYYIYDGLGFLLGSDGISGTDCYVQATGITVTGNCNPPTTGACCYYAGGCDMVPEAECDPALGLFLGLGHQCIECPCFVPCPPEGVPEQEPCGSSTNDGCNAAGWPFEPISCGETICGTMWANTSLRDTDWYQLTLTEGQYLTWTAESQVPLLIYIIQGAGPNDCSSYTILASATAGECQTATIGPIEGAPGITYWFWAGPSAWNNWPCDKDYTATLTCAVVPTGACCLPPGTCIETTPGGCAAQNGVYQGDYTLCANIECGGFYCPGGAQICDEYISRVIVDTIDNPSGCEAGQYADYTYDVTGWQVNLPIGASIPLTVANGNPIWSADTCSVWVDWNHDYIFDDAAPEALGDLPGVGPYNFTLTPLDGAVLGPTRMRIRIDYANANPSPCGTTMYGEVEDYTVNVAEWSGYCAASGGCGEYIARVQINAVDNSTNCTEYGDYTYLSANIPYEATTYLTVTNGSPQPLDRATYWIDWDDNGVFTESERGAIRTGNGPYVWMITPYVPAGPRRLRIRVQRADPVPQPCGATEFGEVEDYTVNIGGTEPGACCWPDGTCTSEEQAACAGSWGGPVTVCAGSDCNGNAVDDFCDTLSGTSADCNANNVPDECDIASGTSQDCQPNGIPDECELGPGGLDLQLDDGTSENTWGLTSGGELCWINHFDAFGVISAIGVTFGSPAYPGSAGVTPGQEFRVYVWGDVNDDGVPSGSDFIAFAVGTAEAGSIDTDEVQVVPLDAPLAVSGSFFIGASVNAPAGGYPATADDDGWTGAPDQGFLAFNSIPFDPTNLGNLYAMSQLGYPTTVFILRTVGGPGSDCNNNGVPDECDIAGGTSQDCDSNGIPDECEPGGTADCDNDGMTDLCTIAYCEGIPWCSDCNGNLVPDGCDIADGTSLDCNGNGVPDECDVIGRISEDCNDNGIPDECDIASGSSCDCQGDGIPDECQLDDRDGDYPLQWDDGSTEDSLGLTAGGELCWLAHFTRPAGEPTCRVSQILTSFGTPSYPGSSGVSAGQTVRVYVWNDPNGDGNPNDAAFLGEATGTVQAGAIDTDVPQSIAVNIGLDIADSFFVGASVVTTSGYPAPMDQNGPQANQAWIVFNSVPFDPVNFGPSLYNMTDIGYVCNWLLRTVVSCGLPANDCNGNGIPDECDIGTQWGGYCAAQGLPCFPTDCDSDWNTNGVPDHCPNELCGDLDSDGNIDIDDYWMFIDAFGTCIGDPKYVPAADMDVDGCVTLLDYQAWRMCYKMANGKEFEVPQPKPMPRPGLAK